MNCYNIRSNGFVECGRETVSIGGRRNVELRAGRSLCRILLNAYPGDSPQMSARGLMLSAQIRGIGDRKMFVARQAWKGCLIFVESEDFAFDTVRSSYFGDISNAWSGLEAVRSAVVSLKGENHGELAQIATLEPGEIAFVADHAKRYIQLALTADGKLSSFPAKVEDFADGLVKRAEARIHRHQGLAWTRYALKTIRMEHKWSQVLDLRLRACNNRTGH